MPRPTLDDLALDALKSDDVSDLLNHIGWTETIRPALLATRDHYTKQLVSATLGTPIESETRLGHSVVISPEQLAGRISGIDYIMDIFTKILTKGKHASEELRKLNINL
jgi:hypothetical protein